MVLVRIRGGGGEEGFQLVRVHLSVMLGEGQHLMPGVLHGACLMDIDMGRLDGDRAFVVRQHGSNDGRIGLGAAHQEMDLTLRAVTSLQDLPLRALGVRIVAVTV